MTPQPVITECLEALVAGHDLSLDQVRSAVGVLMDGQASEVQIAAFLTALRGKGVTATELSGLAQAVRDRAERVHVDDSHLLVDTNSYLRLAQTIADLAQAEHIELAHLIQAMHYKKGEKL